MNGSTETPLRILSVVNLDWNPHFGAARVYLELIDQWHAAGHTVEHFSFSEAFRNADCSSREYAIRRLTFPGKAAEFVRRNSNRFDVIDALIGSLSAPKHTLNFDGLLVGRSVGSHRMYDRFERSVRERWPAEKTGSLAGRLFHSTLNRWYIAQCDLGVRHADLLNVANTEEAQFLRDECNVNRPVIVEPYGLTVANRNALAAAAQAPAERLRQKKISFVGMWGPRKGARVWSEIVRRVRERIPEAEFCFLGTMVQPETVLKELGVSSAGITCIPEYRPDELPRLLSNCTVGAFPSYVEGFGLAVIEQLGAGIPTVAFDQGGPRDILRPSLAQLLVPVDDVAAFSTALVGVLSLSTGEYERVVQESRQTAARYSWSKIAENTLDQYRSVLCPGSPQTEAAAR